MRFSLLRVVLELLRREVRTEAAGREVSLELLPFAVAVVMLVALGLDLRPEVLVLAAPTVTWLVVITAAVPLARSVAAVEREDGTWELLRGVVPPGALVAGKVLWLWAALLFTWLASAGLALVLLQARWSLAALLGALVGTLGLAANTTALGLVLGAAARRAGLLGALVLPTAVPLMLAGVRLAGETDHAAWLALLAVYDTVLLTALWALTPVLLEE